MLFEESIEGVCDFIIEGRSKFEKKSDIYRAMSIPSEFLESYQLRYSEVSGKYNLLTPELFQRIAEIPMIKTATIEVKNERLMGKLKAVKYSQKLHSDIKI